MHSNLQISYKLSIWIKKRVYSIKGYHKATLSSMLSVISVINNGRYVERQNPSGIGYITDVNIENHTMILAYT